MRFALGPPPMADAIPKGDESWHLVDEPSPMRSQVNGILVAVFITAILALILAARHPKYIANLSWPMVILFIFIVTPIHECLHAISFKGGPLSQEVVFGFYPKAVAFYAHYGGIISWYRYIFISLFPLFTLTLIPFAVVVLLKPDQEYIVEIIFANGLASAGDVLATFTIIKQVPRRSVLVNRGMQTCWKSMSDIGLQVDATARRD